MKSRMKYHNLRQRLLGRIPLGPLTRVLIALKAAKKSGELVEKGWEWVVSNARYGFSAARRQVKSPGVVDFTSTEISLR